MILLHTENCVVYDFNRIYIAVICNMKYERIVSHRAVSYSTWPCNSLSLSTVVLNSRDW